MNEVYYCLQVTEVTRTQARKEVHAQTNNESKSFKIYHSTTVTFLAVVIVVYLKLLPNQFLVQKTTFSASEN